MYIAIRYDGLYTMYCIHMYIIRNVGYANDGGRYVLEKRPACIYVYVYIHIRVIKFWHFSFKQ